MIHLLLVLVSLAHLVAGASTNSTDSSCPPTDGTPRSVWSILGVCALTLLICVWHALHPDVPGLGEKWYQIWLKRVGFVVASFFAPEVVVGRACEEWCNAHRQIKKFREKGYEFSMTHSHFARMDGFLYHDETGRSRKIYADRFLELCKEGSVVNPLITENEIKGWGKSDAVGKTIFTLQLFWFGLQVVVRGSKGLAITLVELDTVCMAVLALVYLFFWWDKPLRPNSPYVFWHAKEKNVYSAGALSNAWRSEPGCLHTFFSYFVCMRKEVSSDKERAGTDEHCLPNPGRVMAFFENMDVERVSVGSFMITWLILGALHLIAWDFEFPTEVEKSIWRIASLILAVSSPILGAVIFFKIVGDKLRLEWTEGTAVILGFFVCFSAVASRALLVGLMLASLRALPCSAYDTVSWTSYIPHL